MLTFQLSWEQVCSGFGFADYTANSLSPIWNTFLKRKENCEATKLTTSLTFLWSWMICFIWAQLWVRNYKTVNLWSCHSKKWSSISVHFCKQSLQKKIGCENCWIVFPPVGDHPREIAGKWVFALEATWAVIYGYLFPALGNIWKNSSGTKAHFKDCRLCCTQASWDETRYYWGTLQGSQVAVTLLG